MSSSGIDFHWCVFAFRRRMRRNAREKILWLTCFVNSAATRSLYHDMFFSPTGSLARVYRLEGKPSFNSHTTELGAPWPQGQVFKSVKMTVILACNSLSELTPLMSCRSTSFALTDAEGKGVPVQSAPLAYWPDGSLKWSGHSIPPNSGLSDKVCRRRLNERSPVLESHR